jgi:4-amino-4-deoxy-L-arabinose transferase-like glycosyltransferase
MILLLRMVKKIDPRHFASLAALFTALALFAFRSADDNRLFNWQWVFAYRGTSVMFPLLISGIISAYVLARVSLIERRPIIFLVLFSFVTTAIFWTEPELIMDASRYFTQAKHLEVYGIEYFFSAWGKDITVWTDLPAIPFLYGLIFRFFGENRIFIQAFTTMLFSGTLVLTYLIGKTLWNEELGFHAGMLLLGMPFLLTQVPLMLVDVPTMFFLSLSIFTFIKALDRGGGPMILLSALAVFFTVFSKYSAWMMLSVLVVILLISSKKDPKVALRRSSAVILLTGLLIGTVAALKFDVLSEQITLLLSYQKPGLDRWGESFISTFLFQIHPFITLAAACSIIVAFKKRDWNYAIISWLVALVLVFDIRRIRYILPAFPLLALMAAYGLQNITRKELRRFIVFVVVCSSLILAIFSYLPFARQTSAENLRDAGEYLNASGIDAVEIITLPLKDPVVNPSVSVPLLDLFTKKRMVYQYHPESFPPPKDVEISSLRFTWEYTNPQYYAGDQTEKNHTAIMIISGEANSSLSPSVVQRLQGYRMTKRFGIASDPFRYKTIVEIFSPEQTLLEKRASRDR